VINAIKFSIEEIEASDQYFDHTPSIFRAAKGRPKQPILGSAGCNFEPRALTAETRRMAA
jgi:hypothetical protein